VIFTARTLYVAGGIYGRRVGWDVRRSATARKLPVSTSIEFPVQKCRRCQCVDLYSASPEPPPPPLCAGRVSIVRTKNVFSRRLKAASVEFGLRTGSGRLFEAEATANGKSSAVVRVESVTWYVH